MLGASHDRARPARRCRAVLAGARSAGTAVVTLLFVTTAAAAPATTQADPNGGFSFQTPSGNIACNLGPAADGGIDGLVACDIGDHTYATPPRPSNCHLGWGDRVVLAQGNPPDLACHGDTMRTPDRNTLDGGETAFSGAIRCEIESARVTCTDTTTSRFFRLSRESYEMQ